MVDLFFDVIVWVIVHWLELLVLIAAYLAVSAVLSLKVDIQALLAQCRKIARQNETTKEDLEVAEANLADVYHSVHALHREIRDRSTEEE